MVLGDLEPPHLPHNAVLRKAKQERQDINLGPNNETDPIKNIFKMKYGLHAGTIHSIAFDPFFVQYWTLEQMATYVQYPNYLSIDATGSLVKKLKLPNGELSSHIYLYQIVCETPTAKMPVFQMLSAAQRTNAILYWLFEIRRIGSLHKISFRCPQQIVCDFDRALMGAIVRAFGNCNNLKEYLSTCYLLLANKNDKPPGCFLRLNISRYVSLKTVWKIFTSVHPNVKTFYIMIMCLLSRATDFIELKQIVRAAIILCSSENVGKDGNQQDTLAEKSRILLCQKIRGIPDVERVADWGTEIGRDVDDSDLLLTDIYQNDIYHDSEKLTSAKNNAMIAWVDVF